VSDRSLQVHHRITDRREPPLDRHPISPNHHRGAHPGRSSSTPSALVDAAGSGTSDHGRARLVTPSADIQRIAWAAEALDIGLSTAYRLAEVGQLPGAFKVGGQWRVSVPLFMQAVHGTAEGGA
jgi:hypothetical protein